MSIWRLVAMEIWHRKLSFAIALLAIVVAVGYAICSLGIIQGHRLRTERQVAALDDEIRKITKAMGFNINILPAEQNLSDFHANDFAQKTMPYEYVERLARSEFVKSVRHLRPALIQKMEWPEYGRQIVLMGVSGVVPLTHLSNPKPLADAIPAGTANIGAVLADELKIKEGQEVQLQGHNLRVKTIYPHRGSKDDITLWVDLKLAQSMLQLTDRINLIQALECNCASIDRLAEIRGEIRQELGGDVQVIELATQAIARAEARETVRKEGVATLARMQDRAALQVFLLTIAGTLLIGMLALANVRERTAEIGILRAIGTSTRAIMALFLSKAMVLGLAGALLGWLLGMVAVTTLEGRTATESGADALASVPIAWNELVSWPLVACLLLLTPILTSLASWLPAMFAASQDPAKVLSRD
jgi:ABC-type lipoprotein release transport system permease subunit